MPNVNMCVFYVASICLLSLLSGSEANSFNNSIDPNTRMAYPGGLLFQLATTPVKLIKKTAVLKQQVDFEVLSRNMETLNSFRSQLFAKLDNMMVKSMAFFDAPDEKTFPTTRAVTNLQQQLNKTRHISQTKIQTMHNQLRTFQQRTMQQIVHAQEHQHTWYDDKSLTIAQQSELHYLTTRNRRSLLLILAKLGTAVKTITSMSAFSFLPIFTAFTSINSLLDGTKDRFKPRAIEYKATPQLAKIFKQTNKFLHNQVSDAFTPLGHRDTQLGEYMTALTAIIKKTGIAGINNMQLDNIPRLKRVYLTQFGDRRKALLHKTEKDHPYADKNVLRAMKKWSDSESQMMLRLHQIEVIMTEFRMECEETIELARAAYAKATDEVSEVSDFLDHITQARTMAESDIFQSEWAKLRKEPHVTQEFIASLESQLTRVTPKLKFVAQEYQLHYEVQLIDQHLSFQMYRSKYVPFDTTHGTFVLNHMDTIQLIDPISKHAKTLPSEQLHSCQATREAYYCDQGIMEHDQGHECINALKNGNPQDTLAHCTLAPAIRTNQLVRLTDSLIYFDQKDTPATQKCASTTRFTLTGQGTFYISPSCTLNVLHSTFHSQVKNPYAKTLPTIKQIAPLHFDQDLVDTHPQTFPRQIRSYLTVHMAVITHAIEAIFLALTALIIRAIAQKAQPASHPRQNPDPEIGNPSSPSSNLPPATETHFVVHESDQHSHATLARQLNGNQAANLNHTPTYDPIAQAHDTGVAPSTTPTPRRVAFMPTPSAPTLDNRQTTDDNLPYSPTAHRRFV